PVSGVGGDVSQGRDRVEVLAGELTGRGGEPTIVSRATPTDDVDRFAPAVPEIPQTLTEGGVGAQASLPREDADARRLHWSLGHHQPRPCQQGTGTQEKCPPIDHSSSTPDDGHARADRTYTRPQACWFGFAWYAECTALERLPERPVQMVVESHRYSRGRRRSCLIIALYPTFSGSRPGAIPSGSGSSSWPPPCCASRPAWSAGSSRWSPDCRSTRPASFSWAWAASG